MGFENDAYKEEIEKAYAPLDAIEKEIDALVKEE